MKQKDKELLIKDLCGRLPYGVFIDDGITITKLTGSIIDIVSHKRTLYIKPYLRPMSSITDEECDEWAQLESDEWGANSIDWLNRKMFDYRGLIPNRLALVAPEGMYEDPDWRQLRTLLL